MNEIKAIHTENDQMYLLREIEVGVFTVGNEGLDVNTIKKAKRDATKSIGRYRHFKGGEYKVIGVVVDNNRGKYICYKPLYDSQVDYYMRPYNMFFSKVDKDKYPDVTQKYRFQNVNKPEGKSIFEWNKVISKNKVSKKNSVNKNNNSKAINIKKSNKSNNK